MQNLELSKLLHMEFDFQKFLNESITWKRHEKNTRYFYTYFDKDLILLRLNDFPDEPLLTIIVGIEIKDIDDTPSKWIIPW